MNRQIPLFYKIKKHFEISSPRSLYACKRQGIQPWELQPKSIIEIKELYKNDLANDDDLNAVAQRYEEKRQEKIKILIQVHIFYTILSNLFKKSLRNEMKSLRLKKMATCPNTRAFINSKKNIGLI